MNAWDYAGQSMLYGWAYPITNGANGIPSRLHVVGSVSQRSPLRLAVPGNNIATVVAGQQRPVHGQPGDPGHDELRPQGRLRLPAARARSTREGWPSRSSSCTSRSASAVQPGCRAARRSRPSRLERTGRRASCRRPRYVLSRGPAVPSELPLGCRLRLGSSSGRRSGFLGLRTIVGLEDGIHLLLIVVGRAIERKVAVIDLERQDRQRSQIEPAGALGPDVGDG